MFDSIYFHISIELLGGFISLLISIKIIGKRQMSQISPFDFISAIVLGELLGNAIYDDNVTLYQIIFASLLWTFLLFITEKITQKLNFSRKLVQSAPTFIIYEGKFDYEQLKKERLDFPEVLALLRNKDVFSIQDVDYCIFESSGNITVIKNTSSNPVLTLPIILEGKIVRDNLKYTMHDEKWVFNKLHNLKIKNIKDILYAEWNEKDEIFIQKYNDKYQ